eukprot:Lankesteria_metandrocarpae@DN3942_c0_g1_i3.p1
MGRSSFDSYDSHSGGELSPHDRDSVVDYGEENMLDTSDNNYDQQLDATDLVDSAEKILDSDIGKEVGRIGAEKKVNAEESRRREVTKSGTDDSSSAANTGSNLMAKNKTNKNVSLQGIPETTTSRHSGKSKTSDKPLKVDVDIQCDPPNDHPFLGGRELLPPRYAPTATTRLLSPTTYTHHHHHQQQPPHHHGQGILSPAYAPTTNRLYTPHQPSSMIPMQSSQYHKPQYASSQHAYGTDPQVRYVAQPQQQQQQAIGMSTAYRHTPYKSHTTSPLAPAYPLQSQAVMPYRPQYAVQGGKYASDAPHHHQVLVSPRNGPHIVRSGGSAVSIAQLRPATLNALKTVPPGMTAPTNYSRMQDYRNSPKRTSRTSKTSRYNEPHSYQNFGSTSTRYIYDVYEPFQGTQRYAPPVEQPQVWYPLAVYFSSAE